MALTHDELCQIAYQFLKRNGFKVCFHDCFVAVTSTGEQPDAMGFRNFASCLIEAKCSVQTCLQTGRSASVSARSLAWVTGDSLSASRDYLCRRPSARLGVTACSQWKGSKGSRMATGKLLLGNAEDKPFTGNKQVECDYMLSALRRMELRGHLNEIYDGVIVNRAAEGANQ